MGNGVDHATAQKVGAIISNNSLPEARLKERLWEMSKASSASFAAITKCVIHWEFLGDRKRAGVLADIIVGLAKIERERPDLRWEQTVGSTLAATLQSDRNIQVENEDERRMRRDRAEIAQLVFQRLIAETDAPIYFVGPLLGAMRDPEQIKIAKELLDRMDGKRLGRADADAMRLIMSVGTAALGHEERRGHTEKMLGRIIDEGECDLVYFVAPLLAALNDAEAKGSAEWLLRRMDGKRLGAADAETMKRTVSIGTAIMDDEERRGHTEKMLGRIIDEGECDLVYFVGPLLAAMKDPTCGQAARELLDRMEGKRLGRADAETMKKIAAISTTAMVHERQGEHVRRILRKIIDEGDCDLIYLMGPLLAALKDPRCSEIVKELLERAEGKRLGPADAETLKKLGYVGFAAMRNANERKHVKMIFGKMIEEGECELVHITVPILGAMRYPDQMDTVKGLLGQMEGKRLGTADAETVDKIASIAAVAMKNGEEQPYVMRIMGMLIEEGGCDLIHFVAPLLKDMKETGKAEAIEALFDRMGDRRLGAADAETLKRIASVASAAMNSERRRPYVKKILGKIIDEGQCDMIYFVGPLIGATQSSVCGHLASGLLDRMEDKRLGAADSETMKMIASVGIAAMRDKKRRVHVKKMFRKIIEEGQCDLVYFVGPLVAAMQSPDYGNLAMDLLDRMEGKRLGKPDVETTESITRIFKAAKYGVTQSRYVREFTERLKKEGTTIGFDNSYVGPQWKPRNQGGNWNNGGKRKNRA